MFEGLLKTKFYTKSKSDIKLIRARIDMILKKRNSMQNYMRNDVADLLKSGFDVNAYDRVDGLLVELSRTSCYGFIYHSSLHILNHLIVMDKQRECPEECKEAVSSLMFAAASFADLPELRELRALFLENYGDSVKSYANKEFVEKSKSGGRPSKEMKLQLLRDIASEYGLQWNSKDLQIKLRDEPASENSHGTKRLDHESNLVDDSTNNSVKKTDGAESECKSSREVDVPKRIISLSNFGQEVVVKIEDKLPIKREDLAPPSDNNTPHMPKKPHDVPHVKDIQEDTITRNGKSNESESVAIVVLEVENHENKSQTLKLEKRQKTPLKYPSVPAHIKSEVREKSFHLSEYSTRDRQTDEDRIGSMGKARTVPKSVRTRHAKPPPMRENADTSDRRDHSKEHRESVGEGQRILKFFDEGWKNQDDEKTMDELLLHYSKKMGPQKTSKSSSDIATPGSSKATNRNGPNRMTSLPCETSCVAEMPKVHPRASSFNGEILKPNEHAHVHPKLPEYDDFVARLASLR